MITRYALAGIITFLVVPFLVVIGQIVVGLVGGQLLLLACAGSIGYALFKTITKQNYDHKTGDDAEDGAFD